MIVGCEEIIYGNDAQNVPQIICRLLCKFSTTGIENDLD
jgi:hypothetical protein